MALDAGSVYATLGFRVEDKGVAQFEKRLKSVKDAADKAELSFKKGKSRFDGFGSAAAKATLAMAPFAAIVVDSAQKAMKFGKVLNELKATSGATGKEMAKLRALALDLGTKTGVGATKAAQALTELSKGGIKLNQLAPALKGTLALAQAGGLDVAEAATLAANALNLFGLKGRDAAKVADALATAANATTADVADFGMALTQGGAAAKAAGLSFQETVTWLEALALAGVKGSDAGTSLKAAMTQLANPSKEAAAAAKKLGIDVFDASGKMKPIAQVAGEIRDGFKSLTAEQKLQAATTLAGTDGMRALLALYDQGPEKMRRLEEGLTKQGAAADVAKTKQEGAAGSFAKFNAAVERLQIVFGEALLPSVTDQLEQFTSKLNNLSEADIQAFAQDFADSIRDIGEAINFIADKADTIRDIVNVFKTLEDIKNPLAGLTDGFDGVVDAIAKIGELSLDVFTQIAKGIDKIPGVDMGGAIDALQDAKRNVQELRDEIKGVPDKKDVAINVAAIDAVADIARVAQVMGALPKSVRTRIEASDAPAQATLRRLVGKLALVASARTIARIIGDSSSAEQAASRVRSALASLPASKTVTITMNQVTNVVRNIVGGFGGGGKKRAAGRGPGSTERALIGEGRGAEAVVDPVTGKAALVTGPTIMDLSPSAYVIPEDPAFRGGASDLIRSLAEQLGLRGFKKGKRPKPGAKKKPMPVPAALDPLRLPVDSIENVSQAAREKLQKNTDRQREIPPDLRTLDASIRDIGRRKVKTKAQRANKADDMGRAKEKRAKLAGELKRLKRNEKTLRAEYNQRKRELKQAKDYQAKIAEQEQKAENARTDMAVAAKKGDEAGYEAARKRRLAAIGARRGLLTKAQKSVKSGSQYALELEGMVGGLDVEALDTAAEEFPTEEPEEPEEPTAFTKEEAKRLEDLEGLLSAAELTETVEGPGEDKDILSQIQALGQATLDRLRGQGAAGALIGEAADVVKGARDRLADLDQQRKDEDTDQDLQAQLDQERRRREAAEGEARINAQALAVFGGPGDISQGGANALAAARGVTVNVNTLHPGDPRTLAAVGRAAAGGFGMQANRPAPRRRTGL